MSKVLFPLLPRILQDQIDEEGGFFKSMRFEQKKDQTDVQPSLSKEVDLLFKAPYLSLRGRGGPDPGTGGSQVRNPPPPKIRRAWGLLHAKSYAVSSGWCGAEAWRGTASPGVVPII
ncbi:hypothetical protein AVEN_61004-1 [Araneus ventricosus]|uniref:Uncharacterized protein n=1 Tax=Araneus ventricosus TaxID=182803 RepID=A0A4Y2DDT4_ARAVE|nr:hypothetical protein AVEN_61004-1 [Araneus ventricosus]